MSDTVNTVMLRTSDEGSHGSDYPVYRASRAVPARYTKSPCRQAHNATAARLHRMSKKFKTLNLNFKLILAQLQCFGGFLAS